MLRLFSAIFLRICGRCRHNKKNLSKPFGNYRYCLNCGAKLEFDLENFTTGKKVLNEQDAILRSVERPRAKRTNAKVLRIDRNRKSMQARQ